MYWLVESDHQIEELCNKGYDEAYVDVIGTDANLHPAENNICVVYVRPLNATKGFILPVNHTESFNINKQDIEKLLSDYTTIFTHDSKKLRHYLPLRNIHDCILPPEKWEEELTQTHKIFSRLYKGVINLNRIVPIVKHYEFFELNYDKIRDRLNKNNTKYGRFYNDKVSMVYYNIERNGMGIEPESFFKHFYKHDKPVIHNQYNLNTTTTRPSNKFGGVNYAALNKKTGERSVFVPKNDYLVEFDIMAYHPVIVSQMIGYDFKDRDVHQSFADMYGTTRDEAKGITFQQFYGRIFAKYKDLMYFKLLLRKQDELMSKYENEGFVEEPISGYRFTKDNLGDINKEKLFNYFLQATESSMNVEIIQEMQSILEGASTQIVLTVYDSFLFDVKKGEEDKLKRIQQVFNDRKLNTTIKHGYDYNFRD